MFAETASTYAPGDSQGVYANSQADKVPSRAYQWATPNLVMGALGLAAVVVLVHHWRR